MFCGCGRVRFVVRVIYGLNVVSFRLDKTTVTLNHVDEVLNFTGQVRFYRARFPGRKEGICSKSVRNVGTSSKVFATTERTKRKLGLAELEKSLAVTSKSRRLGATGKC